MAKGVENYEAIEEAVLESARGRWFLGEYASRLRTRESATIASRIATLEAAVSNNHDAITARLSQALGQAPAAPAVAPAPELAPKHMKYFSRDEEIFESAKGPGKAPAPEEKRGARLTIARPGAEAQTPSTEPVIEAETAPSAPAETVETGTVVAHAQPLPDPAPAAEDTPKRRIVIIRHKPGEAINVPLQHEIAAAS